MYACMYLCILFFYICICTSVNVALLYDEISSKVQNRSKSCLGAESLPLWMSAFLRAVCPHVDVYVGAWLNPCVYTFNVLFFWTNYVNFNVDFVICFAFGASLCSFVVALILLILLFSVAPHGAETAKRTTTHGEIGWRWSGIRILWELRGSQCLMWVMSFWVGFLWGSNLQDWPFCFWLDARCWLLMDRASRAWTGSKSVGFNAAQVWAKRSCLQLKFSRGPGDHDWANGSM